MACGGGRLLSRGDSELYGLLDRIQDAALPVIRHYAPRLGMFFCAARVYRLVITASLLRTPVVAGNYCLAVN